MTEQRETFPKLTLNTNNDNSDNLFHLNWLFLISINMANTLVSKYNSKVNVIIEEKSGWILKHLLVLPHMFGCFCFS